MLSSSIIRFHNTKLRLPLARFLLAVSFGLMVTSSIIYQRWSERRMFFRRNYQTQFDLSAWFNRKVTACDGKFEAFGHELVWLKNARLNIIKGSFEISCNTEIPRYWFYRSYEGTPYIKWLKDLKDSLYLHEAYGYTPYMSIPEVKGLVFVVKRNEAHNLYHTMCEIYNIFLLGKIFNIKREEMKILFMDSRPPTIVDQLWLTLFRRVIYHETIDKPIRFENLIWIPIGYESPLNFHVLETIPFINEFHNYLVDAFEVKSTNELDCNHINYTLILRHDYITNPEMVRSREGRIYRKLANEKEVIKTIETSIGQTGHLKTMESETFSLKEQIEIFAKTDVLIGVHGAGMTHLLNLPAHAFVLEFRPFQMFKLPGYHFRAMSRWRGLWYSTVTTTNETDNIFSYEVEIPLDKLKGQIQNIKCKIGELCGQYVPICHQ